MDFEIDTVGDVNIDKKAKKSSRKKQKVLGYDDNIREKDVVANFTKARGTRESREDSNQKYQKVVQSKFSQVIGSTPEWANLDNKETYSDDDDMMKTTGNYLSDEKSSVLPKTTLNFK